MESRGRSVAGDELHCLPGSSRIYGKWAANIIFHDGSRPVGKAILRCITPEHSHIIVAGDGMQTTIFPEIRRDMVRGKLRIIRHQPFFNTRSTTNPQS